MSSVENDSLKISVHDLGVVDADADNLVGHEFKFILNESNQSVHALGGASACDRFKHNLVIA